MLKERQTSFRLGKPWSIQDRSSISLPPDFLSSEDFVIKTLFLKLSTLTKSLSRRFSAKFSLSALSDENASLEKCILIHDEDSGVKKILSFFNSVSLLDLSTPIDHLMCWKKNLDQQAAVDLLTPAAVPKKADSMRSFSALSSSSSSSTSSVSPDPAFFSQVVAEFLFYKATMSCLVSWNEDSSSLHQSTALDLINYCLQQCLTIQHKAELRQLQKITQGYYSQILSILSKTFFNEFLEQYKAIDEQGDLATKINLTYCLRLIRLSPNLAKTKNFLDLVSQNFHKKKSPDLVQHYIELFFTPILISPPLDNQSLYEDELNNYLNIYGHFWKKLKEPAQSILAEMTICAKGKIDMFSQQPFVFMEKVSKQIRSSTGEIRDRLLNALFYLLHSILTRYNEEQCRSMNIPIDLIIEKIKSDFFFPLAAKKNAVVDYGCVETLIDIAILISSLKKKVNVINIFIVDNLTSSLEMAGDRTQLMCYLERIMIGLGIFQRIAELTGFSIDKTALFQAKKVADSLAKQFNFSDTSTSSALQCFRKQLILPHIDQMRLVRFDEKQTNSIKASLEQLLRLADPDYRQPFYVFSKSSSSSSDFSLIPLKERKFFIGLLRGCIRSMRIIVPANTSMPELIFILVRYFFNSEPLISREAEKYLNSLFLSRPILRSLIIEAVALTISGIPLSSTDNMIKGEKLLHHLLSSWIVPEFLNRQEPEVETMHLFAKRFPASVVEGVSLIAMSSHSMFLRAIAFLVIKLAGELNSLLSPEERELGERLIDIIHEKERLIVDSIFSQPILSFNSYNSIYENTTFSPNKSSQSCINVEEMASGVTTLYYENIFGYNNSTSIIETDDYDPLQTEWSKCYSFICKFCFPNCQRTFMFAYQQICQDFQEKTTALVQKIQQKEKIAEDIIIWRNQLKFLCSVGEGEEAHKYELPSIPGVSFSPLKMLSFNIQWVFSVIQPLLSLSNPLLRSVAYCGICQLAKSQRWRLLHLMLETPEEIRKKKDLINNYRFQVVNLFADLLDPTETSPVFDSHDCKVFFDFLSEMKKLLEDREALLLSKDNQNWSAVLEVQLLRHSLFKSICFLSQKKVLQTISREQLETLFKYSLVHCGYGSLSQQQQEQDQKLFETITRKRGKEESISPATPIFSDPTLQKVEVVVASKTADKYSIYFQNVDAVEYWAISSISALLESQAKGVEKLLDFQSQMVDALARLSHSYTVQKKQEAGRNCVRAILSIPTSCESQSQILNSFMDLCFKNDARVAKFYFFSIYQALTSNMDVPYSMVSLLNLCFLKSMDPDYEVRNVGVLLLHWLSSRFLKIKNDTFALSSHSELSEGYLNQIIQIANTMSVRHKEIHIDVLNEVLFRIPNLEFDSQRASFRYLVPFLSSLILESFDQDTIHYLLRCFFLLSFHFEFSEPQLISELWQNIVTQSPQSLELISKFCFNQLLTQRNQEFLSLSQRVFLIIARISPEECFKRIFSFLTLNDDVLPPSSSSSSGSPFRGEESGEYQQQQQQQQQLNAGATVEKVGKWNFDQMFTTQDILMAFSFSGLSLIFLSQMVVENVCVWKDYLPHFLHASFLYADSSNRIIYSGAKSLLINSIRAFICQYCSNISSSPEAKQMQQLQNLIELSAHEPLWKSEPQVSVEKEKQSKAIRQLVEVVIKLVDSDTITSSNSLERGSNLTSSIRERWSEVALRICSVNPNFFYVYRSLQIFSNLQPTSMSPATINTLIQAITRFSNPPDFHFSELCSQFIECLGEISVTASSKNILQTPEIFWAVVAFLASSIQQEFQGAIVILEKFISRFEKELEELHSLDNVQQNIFHAITRSFPQKWKNFPGISSFLLKGLCSSLCHQTACNLLSKISALPNYKIFDSNQQSALLANIIGLVPTLASYSGNKDELQRMSNNLAKGLSSINKQALATIFTKYSKCVQNPESSRRFLVEVSEQIVASYFPDQINFVFGFLEEFLDKGNPKQAKSALSFYHCLIEQMEQRMRKIVVVPGLISPLTRYMDLQQFDQVNSQSLWSEASEILHCAIKNTPHMVLSSTARSIELTSQEINRLNELEKPPQIWHHPGMDPHQNQLTLLQSIGTQEKPAKSSVAASSRPLSIRTTISFKDNSWSSTSLRGNMLNLDLDSRVISISDSGSHSSSSSSSSSPSSMASPPSPRDNSWVRSKAEIVSPSQSVQPPNYTKSPVPNRTNTRVAPVVAPATSPIVPATPTTPTNSRVSRIQFNQHRNNSQSK